MTGIALSLTLDDVAARRTLAHLVARGENLFPLMDQIGGALAFSTQERFEHGVGPDGTPWLPSERAKAQGGQTLVDQAHLLNSITHEAAAQEVEVGSNIVYAAIHQEGGQAGRGGSVTLPARPYLGISAEDEIAVDAIVSAYIGEALP